MVRNQIELNSPKGCIQLIKTFCPMQISLAGFILLYFAVLHLFYIKHNFPHYYSISFVVDTCTYKETKCNKTKILLEIEPLIVIKPLLFRSAA